MELAQAIEQLSADHKEVIIALVKQFALQEGVSLDLEQKGLTQPIEGLELWRSWLEVEGRTQGTIKSYTAKYGGTYAKTHAHSPIRERHLK